MTMHWRWMLRAVVMAVVFLSMGWLTVGVGNVFTSPDESANAFFAQQFAETGSLTAHEPLNAIVGGIVHPRSTIAPDTRILPVSFLGFPVATGIAQWIFGAVGMYMFTPILALSAVVALWWTVRRSTQDELLADLSSIFLLTHPAFWYYGARVMMPNVAFVSLLVIGVACFVKASEKKSAWIGFIAGVVAGIGVSMRLVEAPILGVVALIVAVAYRRVLPWRALIGTSIGVLTVMACYLMLNANLYGSAFTSGYTLPDVRAVASDAMVLANTSWFDAMRHTLLPFGFHPRAMAVNAFLYGWLLYPILSTLAVIGAWCAWTAKEHRKAWRTFVVCLGVASVWLIVVYGSWTIADNPDPRAITIGNSHVRYWLPLFAAASVFVALAVKRYIAWSMSLRTRRHMFFKYREIIWLISLIFIVIVLNAQTVLHGDDGLVATRRALHTFAEKQENIVQQTEADAVIIVDRADKYLFPSRRVIVPLRAESTYAAMPALAATVPLYYFGITFPEIDLAYLNEEKLFTMGLLITPVTTIDDETLYRISEIRDEMR